MPVLTPPTPEQRRALAVAAPSLGRAGTWAARIEADAASGERNGVEGRPPRFVDGLRHEANSDAETLSTAIEAVGGTPRE